MKERRLEREKKTIRAMIDIYCRRNHKKTVELSSKYTVCNDCLQLLDYAFKRIDNCPFRANKPTCVNCPVHCYKPDMREQMRRVMRYSGPRMILYNPVLALLHIIDGLKKNEK